MFRQSPRARAVAADIAEIERRMRALEKRLERLGSVASRESASLLGSAHSAGDAIATALTGVAEQFRGGARSVGGEATRFGSEAAKIGGDALRRLVDEVEHRPLVTLAVAAGIGFLAGMAGRRH